jgi:hypothetical protein
LSAHQSFLRRHSRAQCAGAIWVPFGGFRDLGVGVDFALGDLGPGSLGGLLFLQCRIKKLLRPLSRLAAHPVARVEQLSGL